MPVAEDLGLSGVARTLLVPLCARAQAARLFPAAGFADTPAERIVGEIRRTWAAVPIYARARDKGHAMRLVDAGANTAI